MGNSSLYATDNNWSRAFLYIASYFYRSWVLISDSLLFGYLKSVTCYEQGVVIRNLWRSQTIFFRDIVAVQYLAMHKYGNGIFEGTLCHFEVMPYVERTIKVIIFGSKRDSRRMSEIVQIILKSNPDAKLLEWN